MQRFKREGVEFLVDTNIDLKEFLSKTNLLYELSNCYNFEYIGKVTSGSSGSFCLDKRINGHAHKIAIGSNEKVYKNGLAASKRIRLRILKEFNSPDNVRLCEHNTIVARRMQIANARGYDISREDAMNNKNSYMWDDILLNVLT